MEEYDQFAEVLTAAGFTEYHRESVKPYYRDGLFFLMDAGVPEAVAKSERAVGALTRYVLDTYNLNSNEVKLSMLFFQRLKQLTTPEVSTDEKQES